MQGKTSVQTPLIDVLSAVSLLFARLSSELHKNVTLNGLYSRRSTLNDFVHPAISPSQATKSSFEV